MVRDGFIYFFEVIGFNLVVGINESHPFRRDGIEPSIPCSSGAGIFLMQISDLIGVSFLPPFDNGGGSIDGSVINEDDSNIGRVACLVENAGKVVVKIELHIVDGRYDSVLVL